MKTEEKQLYYNSARRFGCGLRVIEGTCVGADGLDEAAGDVVEKSEPDFRLVGRHGVR